MLGGADTQDDNARQGFQHDTGRSAGCANRLPASRPDLILLCPGFTTWYPRPPPPCPGIRELAGIFRFGLGKIRTYIKVFRNKDSGLRRTDCFPFRFSKSAENGFGAGSRAVLV